jgi:hypothetical protein
VKNKVFSKELVPGRGFSRRFFFPLATRFGLENLCFLCTSGKGDFFLSAGKAVEGLSSPVDGIVKGG